MNVEKRKREVKGADQSRRKESNLNPQIPPVLTRRRQMRVATSLWGVSWPGTKRHQGQAEAIWDELKNGPEKV